MSAQHASANIEVYNRPDVAAHYAALNYLTPCERLLFETYVKAGMAVLDVGVGGGRTTSYLSRVASRYVGVDYSAEMIRTCRSKFPGMQFEVADAADLSAFADASFDAIVMAFNGLDYVLPAARRTQCVRGYHRLLRPGGILIFSSHNARAILTRPAWDRDRVRSFAGKLARPGSRWFDLAVAGVTSAKAVQSTIRAGFSSVRRIAARVPASAFWRGEGCFMDPSHGGLMTHCWIPERVVESFAQSGFQLVTLRGDDFPRASGRFVTDWYYYVFSRSETKPCD